MLALGRNGGVGGGAHANEEDSSGGDAWVGQHLDSGWVELGC